MPLYQYACDVCGCEYEQQLPIAERDRSVCHGCGSTAGQHMILGRPAISIRNTEGIITEGACEEKYGKAWRQTPGSIAMARGERQRVHFLPRRS